MSHVEYAIAGRFAPARRKSPIKWDALRLTVVDYAEAEKGDRYLAFTDLLFDALAPATQERHRALVRLEDVGPNADPDKLREVAELLDKECSQSRIATIFPSLSTKIFFSRKSP